MTTQNQLIRSLNIATLNTRGCREESQRNLLINDVIKYDLQILAVSETHIGETGLQEYTRGSQKFSFFYCGKGSHHGVGLIVDQSLNPNFTQISDRICKAEIKLSHRKIVIISAYAPTLSVSEKNPETREEFYQQLEGTVNSIACRNTVVVLGDFNAKTGGSHRDYPEVVGHFGKGSTNSNGESLLEFCKVNNLVLTNTLFKHPLRHRTTWEAPERYHTSALDASGNKCHLKGPDGLPRRNPFRNQIDYIAIRSAHRRFVTDSRSYGGIQSNTDHKMVKMSIKFQWYRLSPAKPPTGTKINMANFSNPMKQQEYREKVHFDPPQPPTSPQDKWTALCSNLIDESKEIMGERIAAKKVSDPVLSELSKQNYHLREKLSAAKNQTERKTIKTEQQKVKNQIRKRKSETEVIEMENKLKDLESVKNDANKYYLALREMNQKKSKQSLCVHNDDKQIVGTEKEQVEAITQHFQRVLGPPSVENTKSYPPTQMTKPFTAGEIQKAAKSMKNGKSCGVDNIHAEHVKYASNSVHETIAEILNETAETDNFPSELKIGVLTPLPKPGKPKGPRENLRPIILLSVLRKILTICLIRRTWDRLSTRIGHDQAAYQTGRSTTEQVFSIKMMAEKAITSSDYKVYILMLDMSKAFDTVDRDKLFEALEEVLLPEELHLLHILTNNVFLKVKVNSTVGESFQTLLGIMQGDCLSAILFIFYLAKALSPRRNAIEQEHNYQIMSNTQVNWKTVRENRTTISPKYADDVTWASTSSEVVEELEVTVPPLLDDYNLQVNNSKTEKYTIPCNDRSDILSEHSYSANPSKDEWKKCKLLGSYIDTEKDIKHRKSLIIDNMKKHKHIYKSKHLSIDLKVRHFNCYQTTIFLYNASLWTLTPTMENRIDAFHRRQLRNVIGFHYPKKISNVDLYRLTNEHHWSETIRERRLRLLGHVCRLPEDTPARQALTEALTHSKRKVGRPKLTWLSLITKDLIKYFKVTPEQDFENIISLASDRMSWRSQIDILHNGGKPSLVG